MILMLDFDGVLHPDITRNEPLFCRLPILDAWLRDRPQIEVVISSSWRKVYPMDVIISFFNSDLQPRVIGATPVWGEERPWWQGLPHERLRMYPREAEVRQWMLDSPEPWRPWVALDDRTDLFSPHCPRLVVCERTLGLTPVQLSQVDELFSMR